MTNPLPPDDLGDLVACPTCDALHRLGAVPVGARAKCTRCGTVLMAPRAGPPPRWC